MEIITVTKDNLEKEHICCAISGEKDCQVKSKKDWLRERFDEGLVFKKGNVRGKCFIEYVPAQNAWAPIDAAEYLYVDCLWVAGQFKGQGYAARLLDECVGEAKETGKSGVCTISSKKKKPYLSDGDFFRHKGFTVADEAPPFYELLYLPLTQGAQPPRFLPHVKEPQPKVEGFVLYYTAQCPYTVKYVPSVVQAAQENGIPLRVVCPQSAAEAQALPAPHTSYSLFKDGKLITHEILQPAKFLQLAGVTK